MTTSNSRLVQLVATGVPAAISFVKGFLCSPVIGGEDLDVTTTFGVTDRAAPLVNGVIGQQLFGGVMIEPETYKETFSADVATQLIINLQTGNQYVTDNSAIQPTVWEISGYVPGAWYEVTGLWMPSLKKSKKKLEGYYQSRRPVKFKTRENEIKWVLIEDMSFDTRADVSNKLPITIKLKEVSYMTFTEGNAASFDPTTGSYNGGSLGAGGGPTVQELRLEQRSASVIRNPPWWEGSGNVNFTPAEAL